MDPQPPEPKGLISSWDGNDVQLFFANLGLPQYEANVKGKYFPLLLSPFGHHHLISSLEHNLTGDVLCIMGPEDLKEMGIATVGQRLAILKAVYLIKLDHDVPFEPDHYIPPC
jgi:protein STE50